MERHEGINDGFYATYLESEVLSSPLNPLINRPVKPVMTQPKTDGCNHQQQFSLSLPTRKNEFAANSISSAQVIMQITVIHVCVCRYPDENMQFCTIKMNSVIHNKLKRLSPATELQSSPISQNLKQMCPKAVTGGKLVALWSSGAEAPQQ